MKLLFLLDEVYSGESANIRLARMLAARLQAMGQQVTLLVNCPPEQQAAFSDFDARFFTCTADKISYELVKRAREQGKGAAGQALALALHPAAAANVASTILRKRTFAEAPWKRAIEDVCGKEPFDAAIAVSCPHYILFALADARITAKKICYMLDPYWSNQAMPYAVSLKRELALYEKIDAAYVTDLMYAENQTVALARWKQKMHVLAFPGLAEKRDGGRAAGIPLAGQIRCVYVGNLYPGVRSPEYLFRLLEQLPAEIGLSLFGGGREGFAPGFFAGWAEKLGPRLALHGPVDPETASDLLLQGDVLVNIGNTVANQLPSKIFEYLSAGRPVLNICKRADCPSLPYFEKYPLALSLQEGDLSADTLARAANFCRRAPGRTVPYAQVAALLPDCTAQAVAARFLQLTQEVTGKE